MTTFKTGDRVRHRKFGLGVVTGSTDDEDPGMIAVRFDGWDEYADPSDYHPMRESAIWHDPPPDPRKRLREYTDLDNGDTVVIGGVALTMTGGYLTNEKGSQMSTGYAIIQDRSQVTALTEERDNWKRAEEESLQYIDELVARADRAERETVVARDERRGVEMALGIITDQLRAERDRAIAERDEALKRNRLGLSAYETVVDCSDWVEAVATALGTYYAYDGPFVAAESTYVVDAIKKGRAERQREIERLEAERDDLGCQLEALRSVQRGDVADLRARMEAMERWREWMDSYERAKTPILVADDEKGGA